MKEEIIQEDEYIKEGRQARINNIPIEENPYAEGTLWYFNWAAGWDFQDFDMLQVDSVEEKTND